MQETQIKKCFFSSRKSKTNSPDIILSDNLATNIFFAHSFSTNNILSDQESRNTTFIQNLPTEIPSEFQISLDVYFDLEKIKTEWNPASSPCPLIFYMMTRNSESKCGFYICFFVIEGKIKIKIKFQCFVESEFECIYEVTSSRWHTIEIHQFIISDLDVEYSFENEDDKCPKYKSINEIPELEIKIDDKIISRAQNRLSKFHKNAPSSLNSSNVPIRNFNFKPLSTAMEQFRSCLGKFKFLNRSYAY